MAELAERVTISRSEYDKLMEDRAKLEKLENRKSAETKKDQNYTYVNLGEAEVLDVTERSFRMKFAETELEGIVPFTLLKGAEDVARVVGETTQETWVADFWAQKKDLIRS